ncbi:ABC transporter ATP-binding protein [Fusibacter sp. A1]|nr:MULTISPECIES: ABC transporter ATP-binding protein [unclassified Fusibacter]MCK8059132.1 ABC transporter ATP-binding protein [Fusibacter sp. A2]NPE22541.1 ABC transporter ATP-binding protein [Fusibacter sp. A1]RXV60643.1 ABC transporter ATP-binding protein [Fusibacter sp. A1]
MGIIQVDNLTKKFGKVTALNQISLQVNEGEVFGFIGPNGAGKTTTIRSILGILKPNEGKINVFGKDAWKEAVAIHKQIAFVPGEVSLWSNLTGGEVIDLFAKLRGSQNKNRRDEMIERFDLDPSKKCRSYSKGNRQKVALVSALSVDADLYLLDEPTSGLDPLMERVFQAYIKELKAAGKTVFLSSHILSEVEQLCDRVSIIREGHLIETGSLKELRHLMRNQVVIETLSPVSNVEGFEGVYDLTVKDNLYKFQTEARHIASIMNQFNEYGILNFESMPPTLEDLFIHHYSNGGKKKHE